MKSNVVCLALGLMMVGPAARGQTAPVDDKSDKTAAADRADKKPSSDTRHHDSRPLETFYLSNASAVNAGNEILTALRLLLDPSDKLYLTPSENAVSLRADPDEIALAKQIISELDRPQKVFRLTYTIDESDAGKRVGIQHFSMLVAAGNRTTLKEGSKVPIVTGSYNYEKNDSQTQMTYLDIGLNVDATVDDFTGGVKLRSKVEQSSMAEEKSGVGPSDPIVRQSVLEGTSLLTLGKPIVLGALDVPGSTRHLDISVVADQVK
jgi:type II secretory pathway component GspD/PulD (secretin)